MLQTLSADTLTANARIVNRLCDNGENRNSLMQAEVNFSFAARRVWKLELPAAAEQLAPNG
jgi:hypothetical protein